MAKRKISAAQKGRLKALRKKHGLGEFKNKSRSVSVRRSSSKMAKRRRSSKSSSGLMGGLQKPIVAGITYAFVQPFLSQFLSRFNIGVQDELVQILAAVVLKGMMKNQIVNNWANAAIIINTASLTRGFASKLMPNTAPALTNGSTPSSQFPSI